MQYNVTCAVAMASCDNISKEQYNAIKALSSINNCVYFCKVNNCAVHFRSITMIGLNIRLVYPSLVAPSVNALQQDLGQLVSDHSKIEKAVSDIANKIEALQLQETKLADRNISDVLEKHTVHS